MAIRQVEVTPQELDVLKENLINYGGESIIVKSNNDSIYKIYKDHITDEQRLNKHKKLLMLDDRNIKYIKKMLGVLLCDGKIVGHEFEYDEDDESMLLAVLNVPDKIEALRRIKRILKYIQKNGIVYPDLKSDNILVNTRNNKIKFCDMDNIQIGGLLPETTEDIIKPYMKDGKVSRRVHSYLHNLMTLDQLITHTGDYYDETIEKLKNEELPSFLSSYNKRLVKQIVNGKKSIGDDYLIDRIKDESVVQYYLR